MAVLIVSHSNKKIYLQSHLWGLGRAEDDQAFRSNLRLIFAVLLAQWSENNPELFGKDSYIFDIITTPHFYKKSYVTTSDQKVWFCSYVGFEKITSKWAKEEFPNCRGYLCMRLYATNAQSEELEAHTVQIYY